MISSRICQFVRKILVITPLIIFLTTSNAMATMIGFDLQLANPAVSIFRVTNTSLTATITGLSVSIGDTSKNFDLVNGVNAFIDSGTALSESLSTPDTIQGGLRDDSIQWSFTGYDPGDRFDFVGDIDDDVLGNTIESFDSVLFNNGVNPNALFSVNFLDGGTARTLSLTLPDGPSGQPRYNFSVQSAPVPEPSTIILMGSGIIGLVGFNYRRNKKST